MRRTWCAVPSRLAAACLLSGALAGPAAAAPADWTEPIPLAFAASEVAMAPDGTVVVAGTFSPGPGLYRSAVMVRPPGSGFGAVQHLNEPSAGFATVALAAGRDGRVVAAWPTSGGLLTAVLPPGGTEFGDQLLFPTPGEDFGGGLDVAVDAAGNATLLWPTTLDTGGGNRIAQMRAATRVVSGVSSVTSIGFRASSGTTFASAQGPVLAVADDGSAVASWVWRTDQGQDSSNQLVAALRAGTGGFGTAQQLDTASDDENGGSYFGGISAASNRTGQVAVSWGTSNSGGGAMIRAALGSSASPGGVLSLPLDPGATTQKPRYPRVVVLESGEAVVAFSADVSAVRRLHFARRPAGQAQFGVLQVIPEGPPVLGGMPPALAAADDGRILCVYPAYANLSSGVWTTVAPPGQGFTAAAPLAEGLSSLNGHAAAMTPQGDGVALRRSVVTSAYASFVSGYDVTGPQLRGLPSAVEGPVGVPLAFAVSPRDIWSPVTSTSWAFGDGAGADAASTTHAYATPGQRTASVTATDAFGHSSTAAVPVTVNAPVAPGSSTAARDTVAPVIGPVTLTRAAFRAAARTPRSPRGSAFRFTLSEDARVTITIVRRASGRRKARTVGRLTRAVKAGTARVSFDGRINGRRLAPGRYSATVAAVDAAGNRANRSGPRFRIVR